MENKRVKLESQSPPASETQHTVDPMQQGTQQEQAPPNASITTGPLPPQQQDYQMGTGPMDGQGRLLPQPNPYGQQQPMGGGMGQQMGMQGQPQGNVVMNMQGQPGQQPMMQHGPQHRMMTRPAAPGLRMGQPAQTMMMQDGPQRFVVPPQKRPGDFMRMPQQQQPQTRIIRTTMSQDHFDILHPSVVLGDSDSVITVISSGQQPLPISDTVVVSMQRPIMAQQQPQPTPQTMPGVQQPGRFEAPPSMPVSMQPQYPRYSGPGTAPSIPQAPVMGPPSAPSAGTSGQYVAMQSPNTGPSHAPAPGHLVPVVKTKEAALCQPLFDVVASLATQSNANQTSMGSKSNYPPNSRLFILGHQSLTEADMRNHFGPYGTIEDCWVVHDKYTEKSNGVCYIKFSKASEACRAMEEMDGKELGNDPRPIKVTMATPLGVGNRRESKQECFNRLRCVLIRVPNKSAYDGEPYTEEKIKFEFSKFGTIANCLMDRSGVNCCVNFEKPSQAATAIEQCDKDFSAVFSDPQKSSLLRK